MATYFSSLPSLPEMPASHHPWAKSINDVFARKIKYAHNSVTSNLEFPKEKVKQREKVPLTQKYKFTVIGSRLTKEFLYCKHLVQGLHWQKPKVFDKPEVRGVTAVEWPKIWNDMKLEHGNIVYCINAPVVVLINGEYLGGPEELQYLLVEIYKYKFNLNINYSKESLNEFMKLCSSTNRPHIYMNFSINGASIGYMIFMLYADLVPRTCENFIRLCTESKGGYKGTPVHRIVQDCWIQCGGFGLKSTDLNCENFIVNFDRRGVLGMANAERHVDCSTQFFVISQAAEWMNTRYVAFGQLIEGEDTLKHIEKSPTWYESPTQEIIICDAGILNMVCQHINKTINKSAVEYITQHIENTIGFSLILYKEILDKVYLEIEERGRFRRQDEDANVLSSKKYNSEVSEYESNIVEDSEFQSRSDLVPDTKLSTDNSSATDRTFSYDSSRANEVSQPLVEPIRPYYLPLTDVPYPGEIDSTTDLKRLLQGHYSLEADIDDKNETKTWMDIPKIPSDNKELQHIMVLSPGSSSESLDSEIEQGINEYYRQAGEKISYSRKIMRDVAKSLNFNKLTDIIEAKTVVADEDIRRIKHVTTDLKASLDRKKRISIEEKNSRDVERKIKRRQTGYIRGEDLKNLLSNFGDDDSEKDDDDDNDDVDDDDINEIQRAKQKPRPVELKYNTDDQETRKSALIRLMEDVSKYDVENDRPTLKNYQSILEEPQERKPMFMSTCTNMEDNARDSYIEILMHRPLLSRSSAILVPTSYKPNSAVNISEKTPVRGSKYAKYRPYLSVKEYIEQNRNGSAT